MTDPGNYVTSYCCGDVTAGCPTGGSDAYLTQVTYPNTGVAHVEKFTYDLASGEVASAIDENSQTTSYTYSDSFARLTESDYPDGCKTKISYSDAGPSPSVTTSKLLSGSTYATTVEVTDGLGHPTETELTSDPSGTDYTVTTLDGMARAVDYIEISAFCNNFRGGCAKNRTK